MYYQQNVLEVQKVKAQIRHCLIVLITCFIFKNMMYLICLSFVGKSHKVTSEHYQNYCNDHIAYFIKTDVRG